MRRRPRPGEPVGEKAKPSGSEFSVARSMASTAGGRPRKITTCRAVLSMAATLAPSGLKIAAVWRPRAAKGVDCPSGVSR